MALLFTVLCGLVALTLGYFINYFATGHLVHSTENIIDSKIKYVETIGVEKALTQQSPNELYMLLDKSGGLPAQNLTIESRLAEGIIVLKNQEKNLTYAAKIITLNNQKMFLVGTDITAISHDFKFMQIIGICSIVFVMLVVFVSYIISVFVVKGTNDIANTAYKIIQTGDLSKRVEIHSNWDDLSHMASVLNLLLQRIQDLMKDIRQVSDNIAHDLRTPLMRIRSHIEQLENQKEKNQLLNEVDHILDTFNALLRISNIEAEKKRSHFSTISISSIIHDVIDLYEPLAEDKNINIITECETASIKGDKDLLFQAYANLLDNAIKFTPENGLVTIKLYTDQNTLIIEIADNGVGIQKEDKKKIFNRFYRGEKSRSSPGSGLGLSLVEAVIKLHDGKIEVVDNNPGLRIITKI